MVIWKSKRGRIYKINTEFEDQLRTQRAIALLVAKMYAADTKLTPEEQQEAIRHLIGLPAFEMEMLMPQSGMQLAESIRAIISKGRATNRSNRDANRPR